MSAPTTNAEDAAWAAQVQAALANPLVNVGNQPVDRSAPTTNEAGPTANEQVANFLLGMFPGIMGSRELIDLLADPRRNIDRECGYPRAPDCYLYYQLFRRDPVFNRVIKCLPNETWKRGVEIYDDEDPETDTPFESAWKKLSKKHKLIPRMKLADVLSGIGRFGLILLGVDDGLPLSEPVARINERGETVKSATPLELTFVKVFDETAVRILTTEPDDSNPRYGLPTMYSVIFTDTASTAGVGVGAASVGTVPSTTQRVHWSRVVHVTDNRMTSDILGVPRGEPAVNAALDARKTRGASSEGFWRGAIPGWALKLAPGVSPHDIDKKDVKEQVEKYQNSAQRMLMLGGLEADSMAPVVVDPTAHLSAHLDAIAIYMDIPKRILFGSEAAQLASGQDADTWKDRLQGRQNGDTTPNLVEPLVDRLLAFGVLPEVEEYYVSWPDPVQLSDSQKAPVSLQQTQALAAYVAGDVEQIAPKAEFLTTVMKFEPRVVEQWIDALEEQELEDDKLEQEVADADAQEAADAAAQGLPTPVRPGVPVAPGVPASPAPVAPPKPAKAPAK